MPKVVGRKYRFPMFNTFRSTFERVLSTHLAIDKAAGGADFLGEEVQFYDSFCMVKR